MPLYLERGFACASVGFKVLGGPIAANPDIFQMDIHHSARFGEYVRLWPGARSNEVAVLDTDRALRQVVLAVKEPRRTFRASWFKRGRDREQIERDLRQRGGRLIGEWRDTWQVELVTPDVERRYLIGMDDLHLFIAHVPQGSTVREAHEALKPRAVRQAELSGARTIQRQGEWFFISPTSEELGRLERVRVLENRPVGRAAENKPHVAEQLIRAGKRANVIYARGLVRHADHRPLPLDDWRRVVLNAEVRATQEERMRQRWID
jgi:hypothetical protein